MTPPSKSTILSKVEGQAFVHRSYVNEHPGLASNERLEFLGDSILSLVISSRLYRLLPDLPEGQLTARRSYLVQTSSLAAKARQLKLDTQLLLSAGEEASGGRNNIGLLANTFEAVLGAMYLEKGLAACEEYLQQVFPDTEILNISHSQIKDPKSALQEAAQAKGLGTPQYKVTASSGPDHAREFTVAVVLGSRQLATGQGNSKQRAESAAAAAALGML